MLCASIVNLHIAGMATEDMILTDPLGHSIWLSQTILTLIAEQLISEVYGDIAAIIQKPALIIETVQESGLELHFFRSVGWHTTVLLSAKKAGDLWTAYHCLKNPSSACLHNLLRKGRQVF